MSDNIIIIFLLLSFIILRNDLSNICKGIYPNFDNIMDCRITLFIKDRTIFCIHHIFIKETLSKLSSLYLNILTPISHTIVICYCYFILVESFHPIQELKLLFYL